MPTLDAEQEQEVRRLMELYPRECAQVLVAAQMWRFSHPQGGAGSERHHETSNENLLLSVMRLNRCEHTFRQQEHARANPRKTSG